MKMMKKKEDKKEDKKEEIIVSGWPKIAKDNICDIIQKKKCDIFIQI